MESMDSSAAAGSDCEEEDPEPEVVTPVEPVDELTAFRQQWQRELNISPATQCGTITKEGAPAQQPLTDEDKAKQLFLCGVEYERCGQMFEAIQQYRRAVQILPDVEARLYDSIDQRDSPEVESSAEEHVECERCLSEDEDVVEGEDLLSRLQRIVSRKGRICQPEHATKGMHISDLPDEVISLVLRWVVSSELDVASLERVASTCRGLYVLTRDHALWRDICRRTWGMECGSPRTLGYPSWRHMVLQRPRLHPHGCYISKTTYLRHGENSFQDQFYRPWYLVDYYRYLRFFPDGVALMWTSPDPPAVCVGLLRSRSPRLGLGILTGHYRLLNDKVIVVVKKSEKKALAVGGNSRFRARRKDGADSHEQTFHCELTLRSVRGRPNHQLVWTRYAVCSRRDQWTPFELTPSRFPPFHFSTVRTYTAEAQAPL